MMMIIIIIIIRLVGLKKHTRHVGFNKPTRQVRFFKHAEHVDLEGKKKIDGPFMDMAHGTALARHEHKWARAVSYAKPLEKKQIGHGMAQSIHLVGCVVPAYGP